MALRFLIVIFISLITSCATQEVIEEPEKITIVAKVLDYEEREEMFHATYEDGVCISYNIDKSHYVVLSPEPYTGQTFPLTHMGRAKVDSLPRKTGAIFSFEIEESRLDNLLNQENIRSFFTYGILKDLIVDAGDQRL